MTEQQFRQLKKNDIIRFNHLSRQNGVGGRITKIVNNGFYTQVHFIRPPRGPLDEVKGVTNLESAYTFDLIGRGNIRLVTEELA